MGEKNLRFDFGKQDIRNMNGRLSYVEGWKRIVQEISLELDTYKGDMPEDPKYDSILKRALNSSNISDEMKKWDGTQAIGRHEEDAFQGHWHNLRGRYTGGSYGNSINMTDRANFANSANDLVNTAVTDRVNGSPRVSNETRPKNIMLPVFILT